MIHRVHAEMGNGPKTPDFTQTFEGNQGSGSYPQYMPQSVQQSVYPS